MTDENDDKQRRERSRRRKRRAQLERAGTKTTAAKKPDLTWLGLDWLDSSRALGRAARNPAARESVTALIHGASMPCGPRRRLGNYGPGPDRRTMVGCFLAFFTHSSQAFLGSPLSCWLSSRRLLALAPTQSRPRCPNPNPNPNRVPPSSERAPNPLFSSSSHPRPCQTLSSPPVGLSFLIQPPTDCRRPPTGHRHPETRSAPFTDISPSPSAPGTRRRSRSLHKSCCVAPA